MDRVKKLKVKKSDGTFTDYIPIGTDAQYIDLADGDNVENKIAFINKNKIYITPEEFGAKGDGVTDDTEAIKNCINTGNNIAFRAGKTYKMTDSSILHSNIIIDGNEATILDERNTNNVLFQFPTTDTNNITIKNLRIINGPTPGRKGIRIGLPGSQFSSKYENINIKNVTIYNDCESNNLATMMIYLVNCYHVLIEDCKFIDKYQLTTNCICCWSTQSLSDGTKVKTYCENITIRNNYFEGGTKGYCSLGTSTSPIEGGNRLFTIIENNKFKNFSENAIDCYHSDFCQIKNNLIASSKKGIFVDGYKALIDGNIITDKWEEQDSNTFKFIPEVGIFNEESFNAVFTNNIIRDCSYAGFVFGAATCGCNIVNNTTCFCEYGIVVDEAYTNLAYYSDDNIISNNHIDSSHKSAILWKQGHLGWLINGNYIKIWGLDAESPQPCILLQNSMSGTMINNIIDNTPVSYTSQYSKAGNISSIISTDNDKRLNSFLFKNNTVSAQLEYLFDIGIGNSIYIEDNYFTKPTNTNINNFKYLPYAEKYIFKNNHWLIGADTWTDLIGGTSIKE